MKRIVDKLIEMNKTISTMESCTGGGVVNKITNIPGASEVLKFSAVTYSNEYKIKMGVSSEVIEKYSVYSIECAREMSKNISMFSKSNYGVGITGKLNRIDKFNNYGSDDLVYISIYDRDNNKYYDYINLRIKSKFNFIQILSDIIRFEILYSYGGIYLDSDTFPIKKFDDNLLKNNSFSQSVLCFRNKKSSPKHLSDDYSVNLSAFLPLLNPKFLKSENGALSVKQHTFIIPVSLMISWE